LALALFGSITLLLSPQVRAQVGPNPGEIPRIEIPATQSPSTNQAVDRGVSESQLVRPAIDELLLSSSTPTQPAASSTTPTNQSNGVQSSSVAQDLQGVNPSSTESQPIGVPAERTTLFGGSDTAGAEASPFARGGYLQTIVSLLGVLLLIVGLAQVYKRLARSQGGLVGQIGAGGQAPSGILEVVGRYPISKGMTLVVLKFDRRILLLSHATGGRGKSAKVGSMELLCELSDPEEVASILLKARSAAGESIAQSFEQTLREADGYTDEHLHENDYSSSYGAGMNQATSPVRFPQQRTEPVRTITSDEGDRAELWSSGQDSRAAAGVLRQRLASMRNGQHTNSEQQG
tara:strand:- start:549 stop:1589 length:1041 start_codon:yes stop_codon:yes gene_type:complete